MGDTLNVDIGFSEKGRKNLPSSTSFNKFDLVSSLCMQGETPPKNLLAKPLRHC